MSSMWSEDKIGSDHFLSLHLHLRAKYEGKLVQLGSATQLLAETRDGTLIHSPTALSPVPNQVPLLERDMMLGGQNSC